MIFITLVAFSLFSAQIVKSNAKSCGYMRKPSQLLSGDTLLNSEIQSIKVPAIFDCVKRCLYKLSCKSINVQTGANLGSELDCVLNNRTVDEAGGTNVAHAAGFLHYEKVNCDLHGKKANCGPIPEVTNSHADITETVSDTLVAYTCSTGSILQGSTLIKCQHTNWTWETPPRCGVFSQPNNHSNHNETETSPGPWKLSTESATTETKLTTETQSTTQQNELSTATVQQTTTQVQITTSKDQTTTNRAEATTTQAQSATTESQPATTQRTTTQDLISTTRTQSSTTQAQITTTPAQISTTEAEITTTQAQITTTRDQTTTTPAQISTTVAEITTTQAQITTTRDQTTTTPAQITTQTQAITTEGLVTTTEIHTSTVEEPTTTEVDCGTPPTVNHAEYAVTGSGANARAEYECNSGYTLNGTSTVACLAGGAWDSTPQCFDINECDLNTDGCDHSCSNTVGSYTCSCNAGYSLHSDNHTCQDINECTLNTDGCEQVCHNHVGGFTCACNAGYQLQGDGHSCQDINECTLNTDGCEQVCHNHDGGFTCTCNAGYQLQGDGHSCQARSSPPVLQFDNMETVCADLSSIVNRDKMGAWFKDTYTASTSSKVWVLPKAHDPKDLYEYSNEADAASASSYASVTELSTHCDGTGAVIYNGHLYCDSHDHDNAEIIKIRISDNQNLVTRQLPSGAGVHDDYTYSGIKNSDTDFAVDEFGMWILYQTDSNGMKLSQVNPTDLSLSNTHSISMTTRGSIGESFMYKGALYMIESNAQQPTIHLRYVYDTLSQTEHEWTNDEMSVPNPGKQLVMLDYNPRDQKLYMMVDDDSKLQAIRYSITEA